MPENDPYRSYNFKLEIGGVVGGHFAECVVAKSSIWNPNLNSFVYNLNDTIPISRIDWDKFPNFVNNMAVFLRWGVTSSRDLWDWRNKLVEGNRDRRNVSIVLLDSQGDNEVMRWNLVDAIVESWAGPDAADDINAAIQALTLKYVRLERA